MLKRELAKFLPGSCFETDSQPEDAPFALFAIGRSVGWLAHSIEQVASQMIIRPRAKYIGLKLNN
nr:citrate/2-methylcitrate synthase [Methylobacterium sp. J-048]